MYQFFTSYQYEYVENKSAGYLLQYDLATGNNISNDFSFNYSIALENNRFDYIYSNLDNYRFLRNLPRWSSASKNFQSNLAKIKQPLFEPLSNRLTHMDLSFHTSEDKPFGYREYDYLLPIGKYSPIPEKIRTEYGFFDYIGEDANLTPDQFPIRKLITEEITYPLFKEDINVSGETIIKGKETYLYVRDLSASIETPIRVTIHGSDEFGKILKEVITLVSNNYNKTIFKYKTVSLVETNLDNLLTLGIKNYLNLDDELSFDNQVGPQKRIASASEGQFFHPHFIKDGVSLNINNGNLFTRRQEFSFAFENIEPNKCFINNLLDCVFLDESESKLYCSKLGFDFYNLYAETSTFNNNDYIYVGDENVQPGDTTTLTINIPLIQSQYKNASHIRVTRKDFEASITYLDADNNWIPDRNTWLKISSSNKIQVPVENINKQSLFQLEIINEIQKYEAGIFLNVIRSYLALENIIDMFYHNNDLILEDSSNKLLRVKEVVRPFFSSTNIYSTGERLDGRALLFSYQPEIIKLDD